MFDYIINMITHSSYKYEPDPPRRVCPNQWVQNCEVCIKAIFQMVLWCFTAVDLLISQFGIYLKVFFSFFSTD